MRKLFYRSILMSLFSGMLLLIPLIHPLATSIPQPNDTFYVLDEVGLLSESTISTIISTSQELQSKTKAQIVVVIVQSMEGQSVETYALDILRDWGIGDTDLDNGLLILLSIDERVSRIEVGYGLEGILNDAKTGRFQDTYMLPYYTAGDFDQGILNGYLAFAQEVAKEYNVTLDINNPIPYSDTSNNISDVPSWISILAIIILVLIFVTMDIRFLNGALLRLFFSIIFSASSGGGSFGGGGSGGGGGSSRRW
ncbi:MAG: TPM domain-containing protein [Erysipelotrichaceae bacterium]|nr:TPM domain-containing protein [Erysipelotrichaceae bacterium]